MEFHLRATGYHLPYGIVQCCVCHVGAVFDMQALLSQIDDVAGSDNFERTISTFDRNFSTNLMNLLDRIMDFSVSNCEHKLMNILYRSVSFTTQIYNNLQEPQLLLKKSRSYL